MNEAARFLTIQFVSLSVSVSHFNVSGSLIQSKLQFVVNLVEFSCFP